MIFTPSLRDCMPKAVEWICRCQGTVMSLMTAVEVIDGFVAEILCN